MRMRRLAGVIIFETELSHGLPINMTTSRGIMDNPLTNITDYFFIQSVERGGFLYLSLQMVS